MYIMYKLLQLVIGGQYKIVMAGGLNKKEEKKSRRAPRGPTSWNVKRMSFLVAVKGLRPFLGKMDQYQTYKQTLTVSPKPKFEIFFRYLQTCWALFKGSFALEMDIS